MFVVVKYPNLPEQFGFFFFLVTDFIMHTLDNRSTTFMAYFDYWTHVRKQIIVLLYFPSLQRNEYFYKKYVYIHINKKKMNI